MRDGVIHFWSLEFSKSWTTWDTDHHPSSRNYWEPRVAVCVIQKKTTWNVGEFVISRVLFSKSLVETFRNTSCESNVVEFTCGCIYWQTNTVFNTKPINRNFHKALVRYFTRLLHAKVDSVFKVRILERFKL